MVGWWCGVATGIAHALAEVWKRLQLGLLIATGRDVATDWGEETGSTRARETRKPAVR
jgi:hypothetical protein